MRVGDQFVIDELRRIKLAHPEFCKYGGLGYCMYGTELLRLSLISKGYDVYGITGLKFKDTPIGVATRDYALDMITNVTDTKGVYKAIKDTYIKDFIHRNVTGHAVLIYGDRCYDMTSSQFGLPDNYPLADFIDTWQTTQITEMIVDMRATFNVSKTIRGAHVRLLDMSTGLNRKPIRNSHLFEVPTNLPKPRSEDNSSMIQSTESISRPIWLNW